MLQDLSASSDDAGAGELRKTGTADLSMRDQEGEKRFVPRFALTCASEGTLPDLHGRISTQLDADTTGNAEAQQLE